MPQVPVPVLHREGLLGPPPTQLDLVVDLAWCEVRTAAVTYTEFDRFGRPRTERLFFLTATDNVSVRWWLTGSGDAMAAVGGLERCTGHCFALCAERCSGRCSGGAGRHCTLRAALAVAVRLGVCIIAQRVVGIVYASRCVWALLWRLRRGLRFIAAWWLRGTMQGKVLHWRGIVVDSAICGCNNGSSLPVGDKMVRCCWWKNGTSLPCGLVGLCKGRFWTGLGLSWILS